MDLCFGIYANVLMICALPGTTNRQMVSTLVGTIDPKNKYGDKNNDTPVSRLMNCTGNFPKIKLSATAGPIRSNGGSLTSVVTRAKGLNPDELTEHFDAVIDLLDEDKKGALVGALRYVVDRDGSLTGTHKALFSKCMGNTLDGTMVDLKRFLAGLFLYTILTNDNTGKDDSLYEIREEGFIDRFASYQADFVPESTAALDGTAAYMQKLSDKFNCIPTILYKEALAPFRDYYVPNDVVWHKPDPAKRYAYLVKRITGVTISKLLRMSRHLVLSGTGGLGKSMMMRNFLLSSVAEFKDLHLVPFFITLKDYDTAYGDIVDYVFSMAYNLWPELTKESLTDLLSEGNALLLFDGLDEVQTSKLKDFTQKMNAFQDRFSKNAIVISSRPYSNFSSFNRYIVLYLQPFTKPQALELVDRYNYRSDAPELQTRFREQLDHELYVTHKGFSDNPLLLSIMMLTFEMDAEVPKVKYLFYQEAYTVLSRRHDAMKDGYTRKLETGWNATLFADYFSFFCARTYSEGVVSFDQTQMEKYFRILKKKYGIAGVTVEDFTYDLINNLCLMYQDGPTYGFIHRSFQEYFCAKYFNAQLDELLEKVIPIFDQDDTTKKGDTTLEMLYDMKPRAVEKYMIYPYLKKLISECEAKNGIWTFLEKLYPGYQMADGDAEVDESGCRPHSNLYSFILDHYQVPLMSPDVNDYPDIAIFTADTMVFREDLNEDDWESNLFPTYIIDYGPPQITGNFYSIRWEDVVKDRESGSDTFDDFAAAVEDPDSSFMREYTAIRNLLEMLEEKVSSHPRTSDIFDLME